MMKKKIPEEFLKLDRITNGVYTSDKNTFPNLNMKALISYCRKNGINPEDITNKEIKQFSKNKRVTNY